MKPIRWGVFGTGAIAQAFVSGLRALPDAEVYAISSRSEDRAQAFAKQHNVPKAYGSYAACVADPLVDIVYIATPNHRHYDDMLLCLAHKKAVLCEKPFCMTADEARHVAAVAKSSSVFCMEGMWMRFIPLVRDLRQKMRDGQIGRPILLAADFGAPTAFDPSNRFFNPELGGGALLDLGVYPISLAFWLFGKPDAVIASATPASTGVDETASVILQYFDGPMAVLNASLTAKFNNAATVYGDRGRLTLQDPFYAAEEMQIALHSGPQPPVGRRSFKARLVDLIKTAPVVAVAARRLRSIMGAHTVIRSHGASPYRFEAAEAMRCLRAGLSESPDMPLDETILILECLDQVKAAFQVGARHHSPRSFPFA